jgi:hypothetical protein
MNEKDVNEMRERRHDDENKSDRLLGDYYSRRARASGRWGDGP